MRFRTSFLLVCVLLVTGVRADLLWDNNLETDGIRGRAVSPPGFPNIRVVDDIVVPTGNPWIVTGFNYQLLEDAEWVHGGLSEVYVWGDVGRRPGGERLFSQVVEHTRVATGNMYFGRFAYKFFSGGLDISLSPGRYWIGIRNPNASGAGTAWWMSSDGGRDGSGTEAGWLSTDQGQNWIPIGSGTQFAFEVHGTVVPEPVSLVTLAALSVAFICRCRRSGRPSVA